MYLSYYNLNKKPFQISTDPSFFWLGEKHKEALSTLKYGVMDDKGFLLLTGDVGTGKTTLINSFVNSLGDDVIISRVSDPGLTQIDFIHYIAKMYQIDTEFETKSEFLILFTRFLEQAHKDDKKVLLIIDEAQHLTDETLEEIRLLSNIENQDKKLLNIFLVGQSEFNETLEKYKNRALRQRLTLNITLYPLKPEETKACIEFRLKIAGSKKDIFTPEAIDTIHSISNGFPRVINIICDHALRLGYQENQEVISAAIIHQCSQTIYALQPSNSHHHGSYVGSNNEWLEESEVPPLSPEAINRISQPLPDYIVDEENEVETNEKTRSSSVTVPLLLITLLLLGFFLFKDNNLETVSNYITTVKKKIIAATLDNDPTITVSQESTQHSTPTLASEKVLTTEDSTTLPVTIPKQLGKQKLEINVSEEALKVEEIKTDPPATSERPKPDISVEVVQEINEPVTNQSKGPTTSSNELAATEIKMIKQESVDSEYNATETAEDKTTEVIKEDVPVIAESTETENNSVTEVTPRDYPEDENSASEAIKNLPIAQDETTAATVDNDVDTETQPSPATKEQSTPQDITPPVVLTEVKPEPQLPPPSSKESNIKNDDPGAVIDWLLKSKQN